MGAGKVSFDWKGKQYQLRRPKVKAFKNFLAAVDRAANAEADEKPGDAVGAMIEAVEVLGCPESVLDDCTDEELRPLYDALTGALWPDSESKNAEAGA